MLQLYLPSFFVHALSAILIPYMQIIIRNHGFSHGSTGMLLGLYEAVGIIGPFVIAGWADRSGRYRSCLLLITLGVIAVSAPFTLVGNPIVMVVSISALAFFFKPVWPIQDAMIMHRTGGDMWRYTKFRASGSLGFICFSLFFQFSGLLVIHDNRSMLLWIVVTSCIYMGSVALVQPDAVVPGRRRASGSWRFWKVADEERIFSRKLLIGISVIAMNRLAMAAIASFYPLYVTEVLHRGDLVSSLMALAAISEVLFMLIAGRLLRSGVRPIILIGVSSFALVIRLLIYTLVPNLGGAVVGQLFHALVYGVFHPAAIMFVNNNIASDRRSVGMALYTSIGTGLPTVVGSALGGYVIEWLGYGGLFASYTVFALTSLLMIVIFRRVLMTRALARS